MRFPQIQKKKKKKKVGDKVEKNPVKGCKL